MIEKIEYQYSDKRRKEGKDATRRAVWTEIFHGHEQLQQAVTPACSGRNSVVSARAVFNAASSEGIHHNER
jgi:hypothetical protein